MKRTSWVLCFLFFSFILVSFVCLLALICVFFYKETAKEHEMGWVGTLVDSDILGKIKKLTKHVLLKSKPIMQR